MARRGYSPGRSYKARFEAQETATKEYDARQADMAKARKAETMSRNMEYAAKGLLNKRLGNIGDSQKQLGRLAPEGVTGVQAGTNLYTDTRQTGATTLGGKAKQFISNLPQNITGNYAEQNQQVLATVAPKTQIAQGGGYGKDQMIQKSTEDLTTLYGSNAAQKYMDSYEFDIEGGSVPFDPKNLNLGSPGDTITSGPSTKDKMNQYSVFSDQTREGLQGGVGGGMNVSSDYFADYKPPTYDSSGKDWTEGMTGEEKYNYINAASERTQDTTGNAGGGAYFPSEIQVASGGEDSNEGLRNQLISEDEDIQTYINKKNETRAQSLSAVDGDPKYKDTGVNPRDRVVADDAFTGFTGDSTAQDFVDEVGKIETTSDAYTDVETGLKDQYDIATDTAGKEQAARDAFLKQQKMNEELKANFDSQMKQRQIAATTNVPTANVGSAVVMPESQDQEKYLNKVGGYYDQQETKKNLEIYKQEQEQLNLKNKLDRAGVENLDDFNLKKEVLGRYTDASQLGEWNAAINKPSTVDPLNTSIDGSGEYPNYTTNNITTAQSKSDAFYEEWGDDVQFNEQGMPIPKQPKVPLDLGEDEFLDEDIVDGDALSAEFKADTIDPLEGDYNLPQNLTLESIAAEDEKIALTKQMDQEANMKSMILDMESGAEDVRDAQVPDEILHPREVEANAKRDAYNKEHGLGKYSDPNVPIINPPATFPNETDPIEGEDEWDAAMREGWDAGANADQSGVLTASASSSDSFDASGNPYAVNTVKDAYELTGNTGETIDTIEAVDVNETAKNIQTNTAEALLDQSTKDVPDVKIDKTDTSGRVTAMDAYNAAGNIKTLASGKGSEEEEIAAAKGLASQAAGKIVKSEVKKTVAKETKEIVAKKLSKEAEKKAITEMTKSAATTGGSALGTAAAVGGGALSAVTGFATAGAAAEGYAAAQERGEVDEMISQGVTATGGAVAGTGGVVTAIGGLLTLTGVGAVVGAPMMAIGGAMTTYGGIAATAGSMYTMADNVLESRNSGGKSGGTSIKRTKSRDRGSNYGRA